jgi:hypothetical protein
MEATEDRGSIALEVWRSLALKGDLPHDALGSMSTGHHQIGDDEKDHQPDEKERDAGAT